MRNRVARRLIALSTVLVLLLAGNAPTASAATIHHGDRVCNLYANSSGFGAYCSAGSGEKAQAAWSWRQVIGIGTTFVPCRDFDIPAGIELPAPPDGKTWSLRLTIVDYDLGSTNPPGGPNAHLERAIVPVSQTERDQCPVLRNQDRFWTHFNEGYPSPVLIIKPTYTPRVNVPTYFALTSDSSHVFKQFGDGRSLAYYGGGTSLTMQAIVGRMLVDPGDGTPPFNCLMGTTKDGDDGYDETKDPFHQTNMCKHVYKRSSATQPDGMYTVKLSIFWHVMYWKTHGDWQRIGNEFEVKAVQRLPVQEVQAIGG
jgi:hypothetical protein